MSTRPVARVRLTAEPKPGGVRWLASLDPRTAAEYAGAVAPLVPAVEHALTANVLANRVLAVHTDPPRIRLEPWRTARNRFRRLVREAAGRAGAALVADVRDCYGSIAGPAVARALEEAAVPPERVGPVLRILERLDALGVRGLPVGPEPSAVLANAVLASADRALAGAGIVHVRWVDDVIAFVPDADGAARALRVLERALGASGLRLAHEKTRVMLDPASIRRGHPGRLSGPRPRPRAAAG